MTSLGVLISIVEIWSSAFIGFIAWKLVPYQEIMTAKSIVISNELHGSVRMGAGLRQQEVRLLAELFA